MEYDALTRLVRVIRPDGTPEGSVTSYAYDAAGNRTRATDPNGNTTRYAHDALRRLVRVTDATGGTAGYAYDPAERLLRVGEVTYEHDANGNLTRKVEGGETTSYAYDFEDRLTRAGDTSYAYDAFGRRVSKETGGEKTTYLFDGPKVVRETTAGETTSYVRGLDRQVVSMRRGSSSPSYYHHDAIGSVVGLSDEAGSLTDSYSYDALGNTLSSTGTTPSPYRYLGNAFDPGSGLHDFHARAYDANLGRFLSRDPVAGFASMPQTLNPYAYGYGNPLAYPDPDGECPICVALLPSAIEAAVAVGEDAALNAALSGGGYYLNHRADKGGIDWGDFGKTVGQETLDQTLSDVNNPLSLLPTRKLERAREVLGFANDVKKARNVPGGRATVNEALSGAERY
jgi:RHS repeat-associated protein